jgi:hypothetical protein
MPAKALRMTTVEPPLRSMRLEVADADAANELFQANGWTDGLPVVPPTEARVRAALDAAGVAPEDVVGVESVRGLPITAEKVAVNAVMAGCLPEYLPVVLAALAAMCDEAYLLHGSSASTGGSAPLLIVNGPVRTRLGMHSGHNALANGARANATIGRAVRLVQINLLGCIPGEMDKSTLGHPGKYTFCMAEDEEGSPWTPVAQERGVPAGRSAVTVLACGSPRQMMNEWTDDPEQLAETFAAEMRSNMLGYSIWPGNYAIVVPRQLREVFIAAGWSKRDLRDYIHRSARVRRRDWRTYGKGSLAARGDEDQEYAALRSPDDLFVVAAGGPAGGFGAVIPPWLGNRSHAVTREIQE